MTREEIIKFATLAAETPEIVDCANVRVLAHKYLTLDARAQALRDAARDMIGDYLIEYGHGAAETVDIESLGWGSNCAPVRLIRALRAFDATEKP